MRLSGVDFVLELRAQPFALSFLPGVNTARGARVVCGGGSVSLTRLGAYEQVGRLERAVQGTGLRKTAEQIARKHKYRS